MEGANNVRKAETVKRLKTQLSALLSTAQAHEHQWLFERLGISIEDRAAFIHRAIASFETREAGCNVNNTSVPKLIHRMWLTSPTAPRLPPADYLTRIAEQMRRLPQYEMVFWINCSEVANFVMSSLASLDRADRTRMRTISIEDLAHDPLFARVKSAIAQNKFVLAGDIFKHLLIAEFGGVYADLGVIFESDVMELLEGNDLALFLCDSLFFQPALMAAPARSPPFQLFRKLLLEPEILSARCIRDAEPLSAGTEIWMHGGIGFTLSLLLFYDGSFRVLPVPPNRGLLHTESLGSWYRETDNYGGVRLAQAGLTHIDPAKCREARRRAEAFDALNRHLSRTALSRLGIQSELNHHHLI